jgi:hypothetical protein
MKLKIRDLKKLISEAIELEMAGKKKAEPLAPTLVDGDKVEGRHDIQFGSGGVYTAEVNTTFRADKAFLTVSVDQDTLNSSDLDNDLGAQDELQAAIEGFVGFPIQWIDQSFQEYTSTRYETFTIYFRHALSFKPVKVHFREDQ